MVKYPNKFKGSKSHSTWKQITNIQGQLPFNTVGNDSIYNWHNFYPKPSNFFSKKIIAEITLISTRIWDFQILKFKNFLLPFIHKTIVSLPPLRHHHSRMLVFTVSDSNNAIVFLRPLLYHHSKMLGFTISNPRMSLSEKGIF